MPCHAMTCCPSTWPVHPLYHPSRPSSPSMACDVTSQPCLRTPCPILAGIGIDNVMACNLSTLPVHSLSSSCGHHHYKLLLNSVCRLLVINTCVMKTSSIHHDSGVWVAATNSVVTICTAFTVTKTTTTVSYTHLMLPTTPYV